MKKGILFIVCLFFFTYSKAQKFSVHNLRCEYKINPLGIDEMQPRFSWELLSEQRDVMQTAYRIKVAKSLSDLKKKEKTGLG